MFFFIYNKPGYLAFLYLSHHTKRFLAFYTIGVRVASSIITSVAFIRLIQHIFITLARPAIAAFCIEVITTLINSVTFATVATYFLIVRPFSLTAFAHQTSTLR